MYLVPTVLGTLVLWVGSSSHFLKINNINTYQLSLSLSLAPFDRLLNTIKLRGQLFPRPLEFGKRTRQIQRKKSSHLSPSHHLLTRPPFQPCIDDLPTLFYAGSKPLIAGALQCNKNKKGIPLSNQRAYHGKQIKSGSSSRSCPDE